MSALYPLLTDQLSSNLTLYIWPKQGYRVLKQRVRLCAESLVVDAARTVLAQHGHALTAEAQLAGRGRTPLDAWQATIDALGMEGVTAQQLRGESEPLLTGRHGERLCTFDVLLRCSF